MPRVRRGAARRQSKKRVLKAVKGFYGSTGSQIRLAKEALTTAYVYARVDRRRKKREYRSLWIIRLSAACRQRNVQYSRFIGACKKAQIGLNRKMLSEIAIADPAAFDKILEKVMAAG